MKLSELIIKLQELQKRFDEEDLDVWIDAGDANQIEVTDVSYTDEVISLS